MAELDQMFHCKPNSVGIVGHDARRGRARDGAIDEHERYQALAALSDDVVVEQRGTVRARQSRSEEHTSELQSPYDLVCRLLLEKKKKKNKNEYCIVLN